MKLVIIGEALSALTAISRDRLNEPASHKMRRLRKRIVHGYSNLDSAYVYGMAKRQAPSLAAAVETVLAEHFPDTHDRLKKRLEQFANDNKESNWPCSQLSSAL